MNSIFFFYSCGLFPWHCSCPSRARCGVWPLWADPLDVWLPPVCALAVITCDKMRAGWEQVPLTPPVAPWRCFLGKSWWETWGLTVHEIPSWLWAPSYGYFTLTLSLGRWWGFPCTTGLKRLGSSKETCFAGQKPFFMHVWPWCTQRSVQGFRCLAHSCFEPRLSQAPVVSRSVLLLP